MRCENQEINAAADEGDGRGPPEASARPLSSLGERRAAPESQWTSVRRSASSGRVGSSHNLSRDPRANVLRRLQSLWRGRVETMAPSRLQPRKAAAETTPRMLQQDGRRVTESVAQPQLALAASNELSAAGRVFAIRALWSTVTDFMPGLPFAVLEFEARAAREHVVRDRETFRSTVFFELETIDDWFPKPEGLLVHLAIADDNLVILRVLLALRRSPHHRANAKLRVDQALRCAIWNRRWRLLRWLASALPLDPDWRWEPDLMSYAVVLRNFSLMNWLFEVCPIESIALSARNVEVRESGDLEMVRWLHARQYPFSVWMMNGAAARGSLDVVEFLNRHRTEGCTTAAMDLAARYGHVHIVRFLHACRSEGCGASALVSAAQNGHLEVVKFLLETRTECCVATAIASALENNHGEVAELLRGNLKN